MRPAFALLLLVLCVTAAPASAADVASGPLRASAGDAAWALSFAQDGGAPLAEAPGVRLGVRVDGTWNRADRILDRRREGDALALRLDASGTPLDVRLEPVAEGAIRVVLRPVPGADRAGVGFAADPGERFLGFGERSDDAGRTGGTVRSRVTEGPYQDVEDPFLPAFVPGPGLNPRADATYFPIPWLLSTRGVGVLVEGDATVTHALGAPWSYEQEDGGTSFVVFAGPAPADVLRRFSAYVGRQPPAAAPYFFGPWIQFKGDEQQNLRALREAGAPTSVAQTYTHYLPCADQRPGVERARTERLHARGLAVTTYVNPMICTNHPRYDEAAARGLLTKRPDGSGPYEYRYTGSTQFLVGQVDFTNPAAHTFFGDVLDEVVRDGHDGWMEDFGEYTPDDAVQHDGSPGPQAHNAYPRLYHAAAHAYARDRAGRPLARFQRSGWTGAARDAQLVWGGDPSTSWGFDGLASAVTNGLTMGLSGVSLWGSDIGGYFALSQPQTTPELLRRWVQAGFATGVMRTQANGFDLGKPGPERAQVFDDDVLPTWTRYARLRTQLQPYLAAAQREYDRTGLPLMRHLALTDPGDARAVATDDAYRFGPDLFVAPVVTPGATQRRAYVPRGTWIDLWRSADDATGTLRLQAPALVEGGAERTLGAAADELPLLVRAGALLPLLPPDVETLAPYGGDAVVNLGDRARRRRLLAWPAYGATAVARPADDATARHVLKRGGDYVLTVRQKRHRRYDLQVVLPKRPCRVTVDRRRVRGYTFADGVLRLAPRLDPNARVVARARC